MLCSFYHRDSSYYIISYSCFIKLYLVGNNSIKALTGEDVSSVSGSGINAVHSHDIKATGNLLCKAISKCLKVLKSDLVCAISELIRYTKAVLDLDRCHGYRCNCSTAVRLCTILCNDIYFAVKIEGEYCLAIKGHRL